MKVTILIEELKKVEDKTRKLKLSVNDVIIKSFQIQDNLITGINLSNSNMTVNELIEELLKFEDKNTKLNLSFNGYIAESFHIQDNLVGSVFLSNYGEDCYFSK